MSWEHGGEAIFSHKMVTLVTCHWPQPWYLEQAMSLVMKAVIRDNTIEMDGPENV